MWDDAVGYEAYVGRWSREVSRQFVSWLNISGPARWLDVGCGTGAVSEAIRHLSPEARIVGIDSSTAYVSDLRRRLGDGTVSTAISRAERLPFGRGAFDATVAGLVLNFVDAAQVMDELRRVTVPHGTVAAYVWDYAGDYQLVRLFWDAAAKVDPESHRHDPATKCEICSPEALREAFAAAGLANIDLFPLDAFAAFPDFEAYWRALDVRQGSLAAYLSAITPEQRRLIRAELARSTPVADGGSIRLRLRAFAVRGRN
jgi:ubiquinone/menaquinone biosynthesis C-methylase UbiE